MIYQEYEPYPYLKEDVRCYWSIVGDAGRLLKFRVLPDCCMDIIFSFTKGGADITAAGVFGDYKDVEHSGFTHLLGIRFLPGAFSRLFGLSSAEFSDSVISVKYTKEFRDIVSCADAGMKDIRTSLEHINNVLAQRKKRSEADLFSYELVERAYSLNFDHSSYEAFSNRTFNRRMAEKIGMNAGKFRSLVRFHKSIALILKGDRTLTDIAYEAGYYDQSHFIKCFNRYTELSPLEWKRSIKDSPVSFLQFPKGIF